MLVRDYIIFILGVDRLVVGRNVDLIIWKFVFAKVLEKVRISGAIEMDIGMVGVFGLHLSAKNL